MPSVISICNAALAEIAADSIAALDEESVSARECNRSFDTVVADTLDRSDWGFRIRRVDAALVINDRTPDWNFAYAKPAGTSRILRVLPQPDTTYPEWGRYSRPLWDMLGAIPFIEVAGTVYANVENAILEYSATAIEISAFPSLFRRAVETELAARIVMPIKKDRALHGDMIKTAEVALQRAIADDRDRYPVQAVEYVSQVELARAGIDTGFCF